MSASSAILVEHGQCSHRDDDGKRCRSRRYTRTTQATRKHPGYCRRHEQDYLAAVDLSERIDAFIADVVPDHTTGCWYWRGSTTGNKRGRFKAGGITWLPYRFAYVAFFGGHRNGAELSHLCGGGNSGNGRGTCVNPAHLAPVGRGTHKRYQPNTERVNAEVGSRNASFFAAFCDENALPVGWCERLPEPWETPTPAEVVPDAENTKVRRPTNSVSLSVPRRDKAVRAPVGRIIRRRPIPPGRPWPPEGTPRLEHVSDPLTANG